MKRYFFLLLLLINVAARGATNTVSERLNGVLYEGTYDTYTGIYSSLTVVGCYDTYSSIVIESSIKINKKTISVTSIASGAFQNQRYLTSVTIPSSITSIGSSAFQGCTGLTSITIPSSVTSFGTSAFQGCTGLTNISISCASIGNSAFKGCRGLTSITIPSTLTSIGSDAFSNTSVEKVFFQGVPNSIGTNAFGEQLEVVDIPDWSMWPSLAGGLDGYYFVLTVNGEKTPDHLIIDNTVTDIPANAYRGLHFKTVVIGPTVATMGANCFTPGNILKTIWLPNVVPSGSPACAKGKMNYCSSSAYGESGIFAAKDSLKRYSSLSSRFTIDGVVYVYEGRTVDVIDCDYDAAPVSSVTIGPDVTYKGISFSVRNIHDYACYDNDSIVGSLHVANNGYVGKSAFYDCDNIQTLTVENQGNIDEYAFYDCDNIQTLTVENQGYIGISAFEKSGVTTKATINNAGYIGNRAFANITGTFAAEVNNQGYIGEQAFYGDNLTTLEVGSDVTTIYTTAFYGGSISESATIRNTGNIGTSAFSNTEGNYAADINNKGSIGSTAFAANAILTLLVGSDVTTIGTSAFAGSTISESATIRNNGNIQENAFAEVTGNYAADINNKGSIGDNAFATNAISTLLVGSDVTSIGSSAFAGSTISTSAQLLNKGSINSMAFQNVKGYFTADINNTGALGNYAFAGSEMKTVDIRNTVTNVGLQAFASGKINERATICHTGTTGRAAFSHINSTSSTNRFLADIQCSGILPDSCFYNSRMSTVTIGNDITSLEYNCFEKSIFSSATIGSSVASIKERGFAEATGFTQMVLPDNVQTMDEQAFKKCTTMQDITLSRGLTLIKEGTFSGCSALSGIFLPQQIDSIGHNVFDDCTVMRTVIFEDKEGDYKLSYSTEKESPLFYTAGLDSVYVGGRLKYDTKAAAYYSPFRAHRSLRALRFTDNEVRIYDREFENCKVLKNIYMGAGIDGIGQYAFSGCTALERVKVGTGARPLGQYSFAGCTSLKNIDLSNVVTIHNNSFQYCSALSMIRLPHTTTSVGNQTFLQCTALKDLIIEDRTDTLSLGFNYNDTSYKGITGAGTPLFSDCPLDSVYIGGPIKYSQTQKDGFSPFFYNESLRTVYVTNNEKQVYHYEFYRCLNMTTIRLGEGVERIEPFGFQTCTGLLNFTFGSTLQSIGAEAFSDCSNVTTIISHATTPPICGDQALEDLNELECTIYVPASSLEAYQAADGWKEFFFYETLDEPEPSIPGDITGDSDVDVADIVAEIDKVLEGSTDAAYDVNSDGSVDVADIVAVIDYVLSYVGTSQPNNAPARRAKNDNLTTDSGILSAQAEADGIRLSLDSEQTYTAFQFVLTLPDGASLTDVVPDADRMDGHILRFYKLSDNSFFILGYASDNHEFYGTQGTLLRMMADVSEDGTASISDVRFATASGESHRLQGLAIDLTAYGTATGISEVKSERVKEEKVFDISGRRMDARRTLPAGIYLFNGKKIVIK